MRSCPCLDWEPNVKYIDGAINIAIIHHFVSGLTPFQFCPYCGRKLMEVNNE